MASSSKKHHADGPARDVTQMLVDWSQGNQAVLPELMPIVYDELRRLAARYLRRHRPDNTLQTTALVHEAYLQLVDQTKVRWQGRVQLFGIAARLMRQIIVDHAREHQAVKRGGAAYRWSLDEAVGLSGPPEGMDLVALDEALTRLAALDPRQGQLVELRFFAGLTIAETAEFLGLSPATAKREWNVARAWLYHELKKP